jgi:8-oxo-dGTP pyrophosphatase MutT (NUDIX family)
MKEIDKIAIEIQQGKILSTKSKGKKYYIPGGKRESGESDEQTL